MLRVFCNKKAFSTAPFEKAITKMGVQMERVVFNPTYFFRFNFRIPELYQIALLN